MLRKLTVLVLLYLHLQLHGQSADSVRLTEVTVNAYLGNRPLLRLPSSANVVDEAEIKKQSGQSLVPVMNTIPGVRMEERSPGSYRLSIRGSLLRSPFGIRNVKIYLEDFPLTDAGGNTYLNLLDQNTIHSIEVLKGPDGSLFGANSGGVVRVNVLSPDTINAIKFGAGGGSYGLFQEYATVKQRIGKHQLSIGEGWQRSDGYRINSRFDRKYAQIADRYQYLPKAHLTVLMFYSNLNYRTPGGLTSNQWITDPHSSRSGALEQKAGVMNATFYGGIANEIALSKTWSHCIVLFGSHTDFKNPFITNYETRLENTLGMRTWFQASNHAEGGIVLKFQTGLELARTNSNIKNYDNNKGTPLFQRKADSLSTNQLFVFSHLLLDFYNKWLLEGGLSLNFNNYTFSTTYPVNAATAPYRRVFVPQVMPKIGVSYQMAALLALRASVSKGYSSPTLAEIRSSTNEVNTSLQPEFGWNYETGFRFRTRNGKLWWDVSAFYYLLDNAIVRRLNDASQEYFVNAGGTKQTGLESQIFIHLLNLRDDGFFKGIDLNNSLTISKFKFNNYTINSIYGTVDYSGNTLTGVPSSTVVSGLEFKLPLRLSIFIQHTYVSSIFLNDANTVWTNDYHLLFLKAACKLINKTKFILEVSAGVDNLLNEQYSLGNDLNAANGMYYNTAMPRNYFGKLEMRF